MTSAAKILLLSLGGGALLGPLAGMAMGPATMKAPPEPAWRLTGQPAIPDAASFDVSASPPEDRSPPTWLTDDTGPRPSALRLAADGTRYAEPRYANWYEGVPVELDEKDETPPQPVAEAPPAESEVVVHRASSPAEEAARDAGEVASDAGFPPA